MNSRRAFWYVTDGSGQVTDTFDYDTGGNLIGRSGATPTTRLFTGEEYDPELGLYNLRARYHNPNTGRFWTRDTVEGSQSDPRSQHLYAYAGNNPVNFIDPSGHEGLEDSMFVSDLTVTTRKMTVDLSSGTSTAINQLPGVAFAGQPKDPSDQFFTQSFSGGRTG